MNREFKEARMFPPVKAWLQAQGFKVFAEVWGHDVVGIRGEDLVCVELKITLSRHAITQAWRATFADLKYVAVASRPRMTRDLVTKTPDIGILRVSDAVEVIREAQREEIFNQQVHDRAVIALRNRTPDETVVGGMPVIAGEGPRQKCRARCAAFVAVNPDAGWREIFQAVDNHYAHHRSMASALGGSWSLNKWKKATEITEHTENPEIER